MASKQELHNAALELASSKALILKELWNEWPIERAQASESIYLLVRESDDKRIRIPMSELISSAVSHQQNYTERFSAHRARRTGARQIVKIGRRVKTTDQHDLAPEKETAPPPPPQPAPSLKAQATPLRPPVENPPSTISNQSDQAQSPKVIISEAINNQPIDINLDTNWSALYLSPPAQLLTPPKPSSVESESEELKSNNSEIIASQQALIEAAEPIESTPDSPADSNLECQPEAIHQSKPAERNRHRPTWGRRIKTSHRLKRRALQSPSMELHRNPAIPSDALPEPPPAPKVSAENEIVQPKPSRPNNTDASPAKSDQTIKHQEISKVNIAEIEREAENPHPHAGSKSYALQPETINQANERDIDSWIIETVLKKVNRPQIVEQRTPFNLIGSVVLVASGLFLISSGWNQINTQPPQPLTTEVPSTPESQEPAIKIEELQGKLKQTLTQVEAKLSGAITKNEAGWQRRGITNDIRNAKTQAGNARQQLEKVVVALKDQEKQPRPIISLQSEDNTDILRATGRQSIGLGIGLFGLALVPLGRIANIKQKPTN